MDNTYQNTTNEEMGWDSPISEDGGELPLLPEGIYPFVVTGFDRERFEGSEKTPPCWKAVLTLEIDGGSNGTTTLKENLFLTRKSEWRLGEFFISIGQKQVGQKEFIPNWTAVLGSRGIAKIKQRQYMSGGSQNIANDVKTFMVPEQAPMPQQSPIYPQAATPAAAPMPQPSAPQQQQMPMQQPAQVNFDPNARI